VVVIGRLILDHIEPRQVDDVVRRQLVGTHGLKEKTLEVVDHVAIRADAFAHIPENKTVPVVAGPRGGPCQAAFERIAAGPADQEIVGVGSEQGVGAFRTLEHVLKHAAVEVLNADTGRNPRGRPGITPSPSQGAWGLKRQQA
jgi:hypothetical protein